MIVELDDTSPVPPYEQIRAQVAAMIGSGALPPGTRLPPIRQLAGDLGLAVNTVARAYRELEAGHLVASRVRTGTVVAPRSPHELDDRTAADTRRLLAEAARSFAATTRRLGIADGDALAAVTAELGGADARDGAGEHTALCDPTVPTVAG